MDTSEKENKKLTKEERVIRMVQVEEMMTRGNCKVSAVAKELGVSYPTAKDYIDMVHLRWSEIDGSNFALARNEMLQKLSEAEHGAWIAFDTADNSSAKVGAINSLIDIQKQKSFITGVTTIMQDK